MRNVVDFVTAGVGVGEKCLVIMENPVRDQIARRLVESGLSVSEGPNRSQVLVLDASDLYMHDGLFYTDRLTGFWQQQLESVVGRWSGLRVFGDAIPTFGTRTARLKLLEYEALINADFRMTVAMCGYDTSVVGRSFLCQARSAHPFIANSRSIRRNTAYIPPSRFLSGFYRFRRTAKEYPATARAIDAAASDLEEVAARTPLTMREIHSFKDALAFVFARMLGHGDRRDQAHIHVTFMPESDKLLVAIRDHVSVGADGLQGLQLHDGDNPLMTEHMVDDFHMESWKDDLIATLVRKYRSLSRR